MALITPAPPPPPTQPSAQPRLITSRHARANHTGRSPHKHANNITCLAPAPSPLAHPTHPHPMQPAYTSRSTQPARSAACLRSVSYDTAATDTVRPCLKSSTWGGGQGVGGWVLVSRLVGGRGHRHQMAGVAQALHGWWLLGCRWVVAEASQSCAARAVFAACRALRGVPPCCRPAPLACLLPAPGPAPRSSRACCLPSGPDDSTMTRMRSSPSHLRASSLQFWVRLLGVTTTALRTAGRPCRQQQGGQAV